MADIRTALGDAYARRMRDAHERHYAYDVHAPEVLRYNAGAPGVVRYCDLQQRLHRAGDRPAHVDADGTERYYWHGRLHRDGDQPAVVGTCFMHYARCGRLHRDGGRPACVDLVTGRCRYYVHGTRCVDADDARRREKDVDLNFAVVR